VIAPWRQARAALRLAASQLRGHLAAKGDETVAPIDGSGGNTMTGRINSLSALSPSGFLTADDGVNLYFDASAVLPDRGAGLAVGQAVTFDLDASKPPTAVNVRVTARVESARRVTKSSMDGSHLQYMGFQHVGSIRVYRFKRVTRGEETREVVINADLALFAKHHVGIQEGPGLCLSRLLSATADASGATLWPPTQSLTDQDMLGYLAKRPVAGARASSKRFRDASQAPAGTV
jgi:cold shock CspA family protein